MDENKTPYLFHSGLKLDIENLKVATHFDDQVRLEEGKVFNNGMMRELLKQVGDFISNDMFFLLLKSIIQVSILNHDNFPRDRQQFVGTKLKVFHTKVKSIQKTKSKLDKFLGEEFNFLIKPVDDSPRKRILKKKIETLEATTSTLQASNENLTAEIMLLEERIKVKDDEIEQIEKKLDVLKCDRQSLYQRVKGLKSGSARKDKKIARLEVPTNSASRGVMTDINNITTNDIVVLSDTLGSNIFKGKRYFGDSKEHKKTTAGKLNFYFEISEQNKRCSEINKREIQRRAKFIDDVSCTVARSPSPQEREMLYTEVIKQNKDIFKNSLKQGGFDLMETLTPEQTINIQTLLRIPTNKLRNLRICLSNLNVNILASERKIGRAKEPLVSHVDKTKIETGFIGLRKTKHDDDVTPCAFLRVNDLKGYLEEIIQRDTGGFSDSKHFDNKWWLMFAGDKGGSHMKYHVEIINSLKNGSVDNVHIYCMFEATDSTENMWKVWLPYYAQIKRMQEDEFTIFGKKVNIFFGGDYHFIDDCMGHQGSSATFPSSTDKVMLSHLQKHPQSAHTPATCPTEMRTITDYFENFNENLADDRNQNNLSLNGKDHNSVAGPMLFPLKSIEYLIPASMHINLGLVLKIYNILLDECKRLDGIEEADAFAAEKERLSQEWEIASLELLGYEQKLIEHGQNVVVMSNRMNRYEAVAKGDVEENMSLANVSDARRKSKKKTKKTVPEAEKCSHSSQCFVTIHDVNVDWVRCDCCDQWYHTMCEVLTPIEELQITNSEVYTCSICKNPEADRTEMFVAKMASLVEEEEEINADVIKAKVKCDDFQATYRSSIGTREKKLNDALESIKVVRQAYHGNVMVGNHCVTVLIKYLVLTEVIDDQPNKPHFDEIFETLSKIMALVMAKRFLSDEERLMLEGLCNNLGTIFPTYFSSHTITRKMHELIFNVPKFVHKWGTIGMLSEQEGESKHAAVNAELRSLACVRNHAEKIQLVLEREELRSISDKKLLKAKPRLCQNCTTTGQHRTFLRSAKDGQRHCPKCEPGLF